MLLKRFNKKGEKYYINAFTGAVVETPYKSPIKVYVKNPNSDKITYSNNIGMGFFRDKSHWEKRNDIRSAFVGKFYDQLRLKVQDRNKKEFILACKRVNINPTLWINISPEKACKRVNINLKKKDVYNY